MASNGLKSTKSQIHVGLEDQRDKKWGSKRLSKDGPRIDRGKKRLRAVKWFVGQMESNR